MVSAQRQPAEAVIELRLDAWMGLRQAAPRGILAVLPSAPSSLEVEGRTKL